jgi:hypothetical protein
MPAMAEARAVDLPSAVLADVARVVGADLTPLGLLPGGVNAGAVLVQLDGGAPAVLKAVPRAHPHQLDETWRARRVTEHMRRQGYPTPAWLGVGMTATHVWHLVDHVDAAPPSGLTPSVVEQLVDVVHLQAGQASEPYDHAAFAWRVARGEDAGPVGPDDRGTPVQAALLRSLTGLAQRSPDVAALVGRLRHACAGAPAPRGAPDMVHADLNPSNVLVRDGVVVAVVDLDNAGSGTRATDLVTLQWHMFEESLDQARRQVWEKILALVGWQTAAVLTATQVLLQLEWSVRTGTHDVVSAVVERGHRAVDELVALAGADRLPSAQRARRPTQNSDILSQPSRSATST